MESSSRQRCIYSFDHFLEKLSLFGAIHDRFNALEANLHHILYRQQCLLCEHGNRAHPHQNTMGAGTKQATLVTALPALTPCERLVSARVQGTST